MKTFYDIQQFLMRYGTLIYTGNRLADLQLMEEEIKELFKTKLIETKDYQAAILLIRQEMTKETDKQKR